MKILKRFPSPLLLPCALVGLIALPFWLSLRDIHQRTLNAELITFVRMGTAEEVRSLLKQGADPNARNVRGLPPESMWEHIVALITRQHRPEFDRAPCALSEAAEVGMGSDHPAIVRLLLEYGADVQQSEHYVRPPLIRAEDFRSVEIVKALLDHGADANVRTLDGTTALRIGIRSASPELVQLLLDHGAQIHTDKDKYGHSDLDEAAIYSQYRGSYATQLARILALLQNALKAHGK